MNRNKRFVFLLFTLLILPAAVFAEKGKVSAKVSAFEGTAEVRFADAKEWQTVENGTVVAEGDVLRTGPASSMTVILVDKAFAAAIFFRENSRLEVIKLAANRETGTQNIFLDLQEGRVLVKTPRLSRYTSRFDIKTPTSTVDIKQGIVTVSVEEGEEGDDPEGTTP